MQQYHIEKQIVYGLAFLLAVLILASCVMPKLPVAVTPGATRPAMPSLTPDTTSDTATPTGALTIENTRWQLISLGLTGAQRPVLADSTITLTFTAAGEVSGSGGCNTYGGSYTITDGRLVLSELVSTLMACTDQAVTEQEQAYLAALQGAGRFAITNGMLTIWYEDESSLLTFVERAPTAPLDSTPVITPGATLTATETITTSTVSALFATK